MSKFLEDLNADIAAGKISVIDGAEHLARWQAILVREEDLFNMRASIEAERYGYDTRILKRQVDYCAGAIYGSRAANDYPLMKRALAIAIAWQDDLSEGGDRAAT